MKDKIFITGISSSIIRRLLDSIDVNQYDIIGISRTLPQNTFGNIKIIKSNIESIHNYQTYLTDCKIIIHAAALTHSFDKQKYYKTNFEASKKIIDLAMKNNVTQFIYISSNTANPNNGAYADSKYLAEKYLKEEFKNHLIFRISEVFGVDNNEGINRFIENAIKRRCILCPEIESPTLSPIHIDDVAEILSRNIFHKVNNKKLIHINGNQKFTLLEILEIIQKNRKLFVVKVSKKVMFRIKKICELIPFSIGIIPDQIDRLYGKKTYYETKELSISRTLKAYITNL